MSSSSCGAVRYRLVGRLSIWHTGNFSSSAAVSFSVSVSRPKAPAISPASMDAVTSCFTCHTKAFSASCTRPASLAQIRQSSGR